MNEQEEINEANADKKWLTYREHISKRFQMRSGKVLPPPPRAATSPSLLICLVLAALDIGLTACEGFWATHWSD